MDEKFKNDLLKSLADISTPLHKLSLIMLANEFYTPEQRRALYEDLEKIKAADKAAYDEVQAARPKDNEDPDTRLKRLGKEVFDQERAPFMRAYEAKRETSDRWLKFSSAHPLIYQLHALKAKKTD